MKTKPDHLNWKLLAFVVIYAILLSIRGDMEPESDKRRLIYNTNSTTCESQARLLDLDIMICP